MATVMTEKELKPPKGNEKTKHLEAEDEGGHVNSGFERMDSRRQDDRRRYDDRQEFQDIERAEQDRPARAPIATIEDYEEERARKFDHVERQLREYKQNFENGRVLRDSQRYRDEVLHQNQAMRERDEDRERRIEEARISYKGTDIYQRPVDEVDTPPFPVSVERTAEPIFARIVNPSVKIMRVDRGVEENGDKYRYSDSSQYDNVPTRMKSTSSPGILKKNKDVSFKVPPPPRSFENGHDRRKGEVESLEEYFGALRTTSTGTQTKLPSSPRDPGYVRHTATNWPHDRKTKTPNSSPEHAT